MQREWESFNLFIATYPLGKQHLFYYYHEGYIYAIDYMNHDLEYCKVPDYINIEEIKEEKLLKKIDKNDM